VPGPAAFSSSARTGDLSGLAVLARTQDAAAVEAAVACLRERLENDPAMAPRLRKCLRFLQGGPVLGAERLAEEVEALDCRAGGEGADIAG
jgi:hypothetical protein